MSVLSAQELDAFLHGQFPNVDLLGLKVESVSPGSIRLRMPYHEMHLRPGGTISGPSMMMLCDTTAYLMTIARIGPTAAAATSSLHINFLRRPTATDVVAEGRLLKLGKRLSVCEVSLFSEEQDEPVAHATVTYALPSSEQGDAQ